MAKPKTEEAEANNGMQNYYFTNALIFGLLSIYCLIYVLEYMDQTCIANDTSPLAIAKAKKAEEDKLAAQAEQAAINAQFGGGGTEAGGAAGGTGGGAATAAATTTAGGGATGAAGAGGGIDDSSGD